MSEVERLDEVKDDATTDRRNLLDREGVLDESFH